jgi:hypothetical protein
MNIRRRIAVAAATFMVLALPGAQAQEKQENYASWPPLQSTFESTGGNDIMIKGYDPVILRDKCVTTFMAVTPAPDVNVYFNVIEFEATQCKAARSAPTASGARWMEARQASTPFRMPSRWLVPARAVKRCYRGCRKAAAERHHAAGIDALLICRFRCRASVLPIFDRFG